MILHTFSIRPLSPHTGMLSCYNYMQPNMWQSYFSCLTTKLLQFMQASPYGHSATAAAALYQDSNTASTATIKHHSLPINVWCMLKTLRELSGFLMGSGDPTVLLTRM
ncbi:hypothetical protein ILYODFUR_038617 [Ilyodon furcidens]|uniref:Uncharacterized protein n=1 Tax=Ilyodon furcidens TaxID=33524 RepID=A0ABV0TIA9_9TELE